MAKLYLVRRSLESYIGPMSVSGLREYYKRMEFGLQDEVAAHCGEWVAFDDVATLVKVYPEIAKLVQEDFLEGWGVSDSTQKRIANNEKARKRASRRDSRQRSKYMIPVAVVLLAAIAVAMYVVRKGSFSSKGHPYPRPDAVNRFVELEDFASFDRAMTNTLPRIVKRVQQSRKAYNEWIPYLRIFAYRHQGEIKGFHAKLLRGMGKYAAPDNCSVDTLSKHWMDGSDQWQKFVSGEGLTNQDWAKISLWDPHWVKRRSNVEGWHIPSNYYVGCLMMSVKTLRKIEKSGRKVPKEFAARTRAVLMLTQGRQPSFPSKQSSPLDYMTCLESAMQSGQLDRCQLTNDAISEDWKKYLAVVKARNTIRVFINERSSLTDSDISQLSKLQREVRPIDRWTKFDYQPELKYLVQIILDNGSLKDAARRVKYEYPEVNFEQL